MIERWGCLLNGYVSFRGKAYVLHDVNTRFFNRYQNARGNFFYYFILVLYTQDWAVCELYRYPGRAQNLTKG